MNHRKRGLHLLQIATTTFQGLGFRHADRSLVARIVPVERRHVDRVGQVIVPVELLGVHFLPVQSNADFHLSGLVIWIAFNVYVEAQPARVSRTTSAVTITVLILIDTRTFLGMFDLWIIVPKAAAVALLWWTHDAWKWLAVTARRLGTVWILSPGVTRKHLMQPAARIIQGLFLIGGIAVAAAHTDSVATKNRLWAGIRWTVFNTTRFLSHTTLTGAADDLHRSWWRRRRRTRRELDLVDGLHAGSGAAAGVSPGDCRTRTRRRRFSGIGPVAVPGALLANALIREADLRGFVFSTLRFHIMR